MGLAAFGVTRYATFFKHVGATKVLDYGTGNLRNAMYLVEKGFAVFAADLPEQVAAIKASCQTIPLAGVIDTDELASRHLNVDVIISTYVFNIIANSTEQHDYLQTVTANLRKGGYLLFEVRCRRPEAVCGPDCSHYFKCSGCTKTYTHDELSDILKPYGLIRRCHYYRHHSLVALFQRDSNR